MAYLHQKGKNFKLLQVSSSINKAIHNKSFNPEYVFLCGIKLRSTPLRLQCLKKWHIFTSNDIILFTVHHHVNRSLNCMPPHCKCFSVNKVRWMWLRFFILRRRININRTGLEQLLLLSSRRLLLLGKTEICPHLLPHTPATHSVITLNYMN